MFKNKDSDNIVLTNKSGIYGKNDTSEKGKDEKVINESGIYRNNNITRRFSRFC